MVNAWEDTMPAKLPTVKAPWKSRFNILLEFVNTELRLYQFGFSCQLVWEPALKGAAANHIPSGEAFVGLEI
jgi:hypothetical protein